MELVGSNQEVSAIVCRDGVQLSVRCQLLFCVSRAHPEGALVGDAQLFVELNAYCKSCSVRRRFTLSRVSTEGIPCVLVSRFHLSVTYFNSH